MTNHNHFSWVTQIKTLLHDTHQSYPVTKAAVWGVKCAQEHSSALQHSLSPQHWHGHRDGGDVSFRSHQCTSRQCCFFYYKGRLHFYKCWLTFLLGSVSSSMYQTRLCKTKDFTFPHSFNKSHLSNVIISGISITVNIFFFTFQYWLSI